ncbi:cysteine sulfinic acid decarboxylase-like [Mercenaria mercenaria]|uniref:cysteine sulfinic acid decarboxylase-like n=1 Tax=Mercenaria mercenaria TaxID=6596 RepID=UPI00234E7B9D|nr:cysteine sulfinic acid decarboxylase-like [Mercenaria mercenaria]
MEEKKAADKLNLGNTFEEEELQSFLHDVEKLIVEEALVKGTSRDVRVTNFRHPKELKGLLNFSIEDGPCSFKELLELCKNVINYSVKTGNPRFFNQLYSGMNVFGLAGSWVTESLNTNIHTFETSPVFVLLDNYIIEKMCGIVGFNGGDGLFCPGGAFSNIMALNISRYKCCPDVKTEGVYGHRRMKIYVSAEGHYSLAKGAMFLGMGSKSVVKIESDERGRMKPDDLERQIVRDKDKGELPMCVVATSGTTVLGSFDPLEDISDICDKYGVWLHCDACWGGGALLSKKHKHLLKAVHRAMSVSWNMHKLTATPMQCSLFLTKEKGLLEECNRFDVEYLFQPDKCYDTSYDIGHKTVQCGRKADSLKLWLMWKGLGDSGMAAIVDKAFENARYFTDQIRGREGFRLVLPEFQLTSVCFWYIPKSLRGREETFEWWEAVSLVGPKIKEKMLHEGTIMIGYQPLQSKGFVNFFRLVVGNAKCNFSDMDFVISEIERYGADL